MCHIKEARVADHAQQNARFVQRRVEHEICLRRVTDEHCIMRYSGVYILENTPTLPGRKYRR